MQRNHINHNDSLIPESVRLGDPIRPRNPPRSTLIEPKKGKEIEVEEEKEGKTREISPAIPLSFRCGHGAPEENHRK